MAFPRKGVLTGDWIFPAIYDVHCETEQTIEAEAFPSQNAQTQVWEMGSSDRAFAISGSSSGTLWCRGDVCVCPPTSIPTPCWLSEQILVVAEIDLKWNWCREMKWLISYFSEHSGVNICSKLYLLQTQNLLAVTLSLDGLAKQLVKQMVSVCILQIILIMQRSLHD